jgi:acyl-CoA thioesterase
MRYNLPVSPGEIWDMDYLIERELVSPFVALLGIIRAEIPELGKARMWLTVRPELYQAQGLVHGGVLYSLADSAVALALHSSTKPAQPIATIEAKMNYFAAVTAGEIAAEARVEHQGRSTAVALCDVINTIGETTRRVGLMVCTFAILAEQPG